MKPTTILAYFAVFSLTAGCGMYVYQATDVQPPLTPRPQSPRHHGGGLEAFEYFEGDFSNPGTTVSGVRPDGSREQVVLKFAGTDPCVKDSGGTQIAALPLYVVSLPGVSSNLCTGEALYESELERCEHDNRSLLAEKAIAVEGYWERPSGRYQKDPTRFTLACLSGVAAKCAHWGYVPSREYNGQSLLPYYKSCVVAARAEYRGSGESTTCTGVIIDIYDKLGIQRREEPAGFTFEALFGENGATCLSRPRYSGCKSVLASRIDSSCMDSADPEGWPPGALIGVWSKADPTNPLCPMAPSHCPL